MQKKQDCIITRKISTCKRTKKAQAAMEFLMTYGWMLLVVLTVIGTLAYFGISRMNIVPTACILEPGIACIDHRITPDEISIALLNGISDFEVVSVEIGNCYKQFSGVVISSGKSEVITLDNCSVGKSKSKFKADLKIIKKDSETGTERVHEGSISGMIE